MTDEKLERTEMPAKWPADNPLGVSELTEFIAAFNESTQQLKQSHDLLGARVEELSGELRRKNEELRARVEEISSLKNYLANILESITDGVLAIDHNQQLVALNEAAARLLPVTEKPPVEKETSLHTLTAAARSLQAGAVLQSRNRELAAILMRAMEKEEAANNIEVEMRSEDGAQRSLAVSASPLRSAAGEVMGAVATFRDNTELRRLERILRRRERLAALGELSAQLAHEIRNPLGGIELFASLLHRALAEQPEEQELAGKIASATASLNRLVEDLLTFTRTVEPKRIAVQAGHLLDGALELAGIETGNNPSGITVIRQYETTVTAMLDPDLIQRALLNVILNAVQMMPQGGTLTLATRVKPQADDSGSARLVISIADTGPGIDAELREKVFDPFFTTRDQGTGLGLAIVHKLVQDHGGSVSLEGGSAGGAVFVFEFPVSSGRES